MTQQPVRLLLGAAACALLLAGVSCKSDGGTTGPDTTIVTPPPVGLKVGDVIQLNVNGNDACSTPILHPAQVVAISNKAIILNDTLNPKNGFSTADFQRFGARFDTLVYPLDVANFGEPTDIDKNGHILILFTRAVNELTMARSSEYVGGFAFSRDLFPKVASARAQACASSNVGELFYLLTPDPTGAVNQNIRSTGFVDSVTTSVLAHEFEHIINSSRRLYVNNASVFEEKWLDEGLAHIAEELLFYRESGLAPRMNLDITALRASTTTRIAYNSDMSGNAGRYRSFLLASSKSSPFTTGDSLPTRGGSWNLLRYSLDRLNATDGYTAGVAQTVAGSGVVTVTPGTTPGDYFAMVVNTTLSSTSSSAYSLAATGITGSTLSLGPTGGPTLSRAASLETVAALQANVSFESALRERERTVLTPLIPAARAWYAHEGAGAPSASLSRSASLSFAADDATILKQLVNSTTAGFPNLQSVVPDLPGFVRDWNASHAVDDVAQLNTQFQQRSWNWHSIYPNLGAGGFAYPLLVTGLADGATVTGTVTAGGAAYYKFAVPASSSATLTLSGTASPSVLLLVIRAK